MEKRGRRQVLGAVVLIAIVALWVFAPPARESVPVGPRPSETARAQDRQQPPADDEGEDEASEQPPLRADLVEVVRASIPKETSDLLERNSFTMPQFEPSDWFPSAGEVPFPKGETAGAIDSLLADLEPVEGSRPELDPQRALAIVELAESEGALDVDPADPWAAVLAVEVERLRSQATYLVAIEDLFTAFEAKFGVGPFDGMERGERNFISQNAEARAWYDAHDIERDNTQQLALAQQLLEDHANHPASDYGRLYALAALADISGNVDDRDLAVQLAFSVLESTDDSLVAEQTLSYLSSWSDDFSLSDGDFAILEGVYEEFPSYGERIEVFALEQAWAADRKQLAASWFERVDASNPDCACGEGTAVRGVSMLSSFYTCGRSCAFIAKARTRLQSLGLTDPRSWQDLLRASALACHADGVPTTPLRGEGTWSKGWTWKWEPQGEFSACIASRANGSPEPPDGQRVVLLAAGASAVGDEQVRSASGQLQLQLMDRQLDLILESAAKQAAELQREIDAAKAAGHPAPEDRLEFHRHVTTMLETLGADQEAVRAQIVD